MPVPFSGQSKEARGRANANSRLSKLANDKARLVHGEIDWDRQIANLRAYFAKRDKPAKKAARKRGPK
jgi:hypothetical protein